MLCCAAVMAALLPQPNLNSKLCRAQRARPAGACHSDPLTHPQATGHPHCRCATMRPRTAGPDPQVAQCAALLTISSRNTHPQSPPGGKRWARTTRCLWHTGAAVHLAIGDAFPDLPRLSFSSRARRHDPRQQASPGNCPLRHAIDAIPQHTHIICKVLLRRLPACRMTVCLMIH